MSVTDDIKQAMQAFLVPELDAIKAQIAEVRGVQNQMSERLSEQAAQILAQRHESAEALARMETRLDGRMDRIESKISVMESSLGARIDHMATSFTARIDRMEDKIERQTDKLDQVIMLLSPQNRAIGG